MKKIIIIVLLALYYSVCFASSGSQYPLDKMTPDLHDKASLQRGAKYFMNYCFGCHAMSFQRYQRVADDLGIPYDLMEDNLIFNDAKIADLMKNGLSKEEGRKWFGIAPPDLTLAARVRGTDWLYTYLRSFYYDPKQTFGSNNMVFINVAMPNVLEPLQGRLIKECKQEGGSESCTLVHDSTVKGSMNAQEFDQAMYDLVNFMAYSSEPVKLERQRIGVYVLLFLAILLMFAWLLKREYWKDIKDKTE